MTKYTKSPSPTWRKSGLMAAFLLIVVASSAVPALADENFGVGADVEIEVERATQQPTIIETGFDFVEIFARVSCFVIGFAFALLLVEIKKGRVTATTGALQGGEKLG